MLVTAVSHLGECFRAFRLRVVLAGFPSDSPLAECIRNCGTSRKDSSVGCFPLGRQRGLLRCSLCCHRGSTAFRPAAHRRWRGSGGPVSNLMGFLPPPRVALPGYRWVCRCGFLSRGRVPARRGSARHAAHPAAPLKLPASRYVRVSRRLMVLARVVLRALENLPLLS